MLESPSLSPWGHSIRRADGHAKRRRGRRRAGSGAQGAKRGARPQDEDAKPHALGGNADQRADSAPAARPVDADTDNATEARRAKHRARASDVGRETPNAPPQSTQASDPRSLPRGSDATPPHTMQCPARILPANRTCGGDQAQAGRSGRPARILPANRTPPGKGGGTTSHERGTSRASNQQVTLTTWENANITTFW